MKWKQGLPTYTPDENRFGTTVSSINYWKYCSITEPPVNRVSGSAPAITEFMLTRTIFIYSVTYKVNIFGKAFAHVQHCLRKEKHMYATNKNIDGFYTKTTQIWGFRVKIIKKSVIPTYSIFQHVYGKHNIVSFYGRIVFWQ
jgi:hypothetical protein